MEIVTNPEAYKIPRYFLNVQKEYKDGNSFQARAHPPPPLPTVAPLDCEAIGIPCYSPPAGHLVGHRRQPA